MIEGLKKHKKLISICLALVLLCSAVLAFAMDRINARAMFNPNLAINYQTFSSRVNVEQSVLFIGTYIIHKDALTDQLYEKAQRSAAESGQDQIYYRSEISDGQWFNIGDIDNGIKGISTEGIPAGIDLINPLYVTYYVGSDGIMKDAKTMAAVNPFDVPDPYDLSKLPELEPIWMQYTMSAEDDEISMEQFLERKNSENNGSVRSGVYYYQILSTFFSLDLRDAETNRLDEQLARLNSNYISLKGQGKDEEAELVFSLMEKVDATRRALIMQRLAENEENLLNTLYTLSSGSYYTPYGNFKDSSSEPNVNEQQPYTVQLEDSVKHDFSGDTTNTFVLSWYSRLGIQNSVNGWWKTLQDEEKNRKQRVIDANEEAENDDFVADESEGEFPFEADEGLLDAIGTAIGNCSDSYTGYLAKALVDSDDILGHAIYDYSTQVIDQTTDSGVGGPVTYLKHATNIRDDVVSDQAGELAMIKDSFITLASNRYSINSKAGVNAGYNSLTNEPTKKSFLDEQKASLESDRSTLQFLIEGIRKRDTAANALAFVNERIKWTESLLTMIPSDPFGPSATSSVEAHLAWLHEEAQKIIDSDESLKSDLDKLKDKKDALQLERDRALDNNDLAGANALDAKIAAVDKDINDEINKNGGKGNDLDDLADSLIDKAMDKLADDANADLSGIAGALADAGAGDKLDELANKAAASGASQDTLNGIQDAKDSMDDGSGGDGSGFGVDPSDPDALLAALEDLMGKSLDEMSDSELVIAAATMSRLSKNGSTGARVLEKRILALLAKKGSKYVYNQYGSDKAIEFVNLKTLSNCTDYRYFYDNGKAVGTMTAGSKILIFRRGTDSMYRQTTDSTPEKLKHELVFSGDLYVSEDDSKALFKCISEYLVDSDKAVCLTEYMESRVEEYVDAISEMLV